MAAAGVFVLDGVSSRAWGKQPKLTKLPASLLPTVGVCGRGGGPVTAPCLQHGDAEPLAPHAAVTAAGNYVPHGESRRVLRVCAPSHVCVRVRTAWRVFAPNVAPCTSLLPSRSPAGLARRAHVHSAGRRAPASVPPQSTHAVGAGGWRAPSDGEGDADADTTCTGLAAARASPPRRGTRASRRYWRRGGSCRAWHETRGGGDRQMADPSKRVQASSGSPSCQCRGWA